MAAGRPTDQTTRVLRAITGRSEDAEAQADPAAEPKGTVHQAPAEEAPEVSGAERARAVAIVALDVLLFGAIAGPISRRRRKTSADWILIGAVVTVLAVDTARALEALAPVDRGSP